MESLNSLTTIDEFAFAECYSLTTLNGLNSLTSIYEGAFSECKSLTTLNGLNKLTTIGDWAFSECKSLTTLNGLNKLTTIGEWAFFECNSLTILEGLGSLITIGNKAFNGCESLTILNGLNSLRTIGSYAFSRCTSLLNIGVCETVEEVGEYAFDGCFKLKFLEFSNRLLNIDKTTVEKLVNTKILLPNNFVTTLRIHHENWISRTNFNEATTFQVFDLEDSQDVEAFNRLESVVRYKLALYFSKKQFELDKELYSRESKEFIKTVLILINKLNNSKFHAPMEIWCIILNFITRMEMSPRDYYKINKRIKQ